jgi:hypothetical protein
MERRSAFAAAGAVVLTAAAAALAIGANFGLFGLTDDATRVGKLEPVAATQPADGSNSAPAEPGPTAISTGAAGSRPSSTAHAGSGSEPQHDSDTHSGAKIKDSDD